MERAKEHRDGKKNNPQEGERRNEAPILYQQSEEGNRIIQPGGKGALGSREHALAAGCHVQGSCEQDAEQDSGTKSEYYLEMVFKHVETDRNTWSKDIFDTEDV